MILFYENTDFKLKNKSLIKDWLEKACEKENKELGDLSFVFCNNKSFLEKNIKYLNHNTISDVITFDYSSKEKISGDIFMNIDCIIINAQKFNVPFINDFYRVMIHGVLHLIGYNDKSDVEKIKMREKEDIYLSEIP